MEPDIVGRLVSVLHEAFPSALLSRYEDFVLEATGAESAEVLLADYDMLTLRRLTAELDHGESQPLDDTEAGRCFVTQSPVVVPVEAGMRAYVPITLRAERLGVLEVVLKGPADGPTLATLQRAALLLGYFLPTLDMYSDVIERSRRERPLTLPAEMQWSMLPVRAYACESFSIAGQLVPAYEVGGDLFDYAIEPQELIVTLTDAMGHGLHASLLGALAVNALRNARRTGLSLADQVRSADRVVYGQFGGDQFVTGLALQIDCESGHALMVNAGHPPAYLLRGGRISELQVPAELPMGLMDKTRYVEHEVQFEPGDRLLLFSDGVVEATSPDGQAFGEERLQGLMFGLLGLPPAEVVRHLVRALREWQRQEPRDDATAVCLDWRPAALATEPLPMPG